MIALIDGDILVYRVGFASQDVEVNFACARMDKMLRDICHACDTDQYEVYLTSDDKSNFRHELYPEYKANRKAPKPIWYLELRTYLVAQHRAIVVTDREADDALADRQYPTSGLEQTVICSIDKDLDQVPGEHYDFVKDVRYPVTPESGLRFFYYQMLTGDRTDNIPGIEGIGPVKAKAILEGVESTSTALFSRVREQYAEKYKKRGDELMLLNGRLLKIGGPLWEFPNVEELEKQQTSSSPTSNEELQQ